MATLQISTTVGIGFLKVYFQRGKKVTEENPSSILLLIDQFDSERLEMMLKLIWLTTLFLGVFASSQSAGSDKGGTLPYVEVALGQSIESIKGIKWPKYSNGSAFELKLIQEPSELLIHLPGGKDLKFKVRNADLHQEKGKLHSVTVRLPIEPLDYQQAIATLDTEYEKLTETRDKVFASTLEGWKTKKLTPGWPETLMSRVTIEDGVKLELGIQTVYHQGEDKWVSFLQFYVH